MLRDVARHSNILKKIVVDDQDTSDIEVNQGYWHDVLNHYFIQGKESRGRQDDDLIFFVKKMVLNVSLCVGDLHFFVSLN